VEGEVLPIERVHLAGELQQVPALAGDQVIAGEVHQGAELANAGEQPAGLELPQDVIQDGLLASGPVQVTFREVVPLPDKGERLGGVKVLVPDLQVRAGVGIGQVRAAAIGLDADLDAAELLGKLVEAVEVELGEVVDLLAGQRLDRIDGGLPAGLVALEVGLPGRHARAGLRELGHLGGHGIPVRVVDLAHGDAVVVHRVLHLDVVVTRDGEADRLLPAREDVYEDQRVGGVTAAVPDVHDVLEVAREGLAAPVGSRFQAHDKDVH